MTEMFGVSRINVSEFRRAFEKEGTFSRKNILEETQNLRRRIVGMRTLINLFIYNFQCVGGGHAGVRSNG